MQSQHNHLHHNTHTYMTAAGSLHRSLFLHSSDTHFIANKLLFLSLVLNSSLSNTHESFSQTTCSHTPSLSTVIFLSWLTILTPPNCPDLPPYSSHPHLTSINTHTHTHSSDASTSPELSLRVDR